MQISNVTTEFLKPAYLYQGITNPESLKKYSVLFLLIHYSA